MHWYGQDGSPAYEVRAKAGHMRATTLADAKKLGLAPSVTTVLDIFDKPALTNWKIDQALMSAMTLPRLDGEPDESFMARAKLDAQEQTKAASEEGTRIHNACEDHFLGRQVPEQYRPHVDAVLAELARIFPGVTDWVAEASFYHPDGFGGKADLHSPSTGHVVDYKGKDGDFSNKKKLDYDQHWQLGGYSGGLRLPLNDCANIFVSRTHPGVVASHVWPKAKVAEGIAVFRAALVAWQCLKNYHPDARRVVL